MKTLTILFALACLLPATVNSQKVDDFQPFQEIKIGTSKAALSNYLVDNQDGSFQFTRSCCKDIFGASVKFISLKFDKQNNVSSIITRTDKKFFTSLQVAEFKGKIDATLEAVAMHHEKTGSPVDRFEWRGKKTQIALIIFILELPPGSSEPIYSAEIEISKL